MKQWWLDNKGALSKLFIFVCGFILGVAFGYDWGDDTSHVFNLGDTELQ